MSAFEDRDFDRLVDGELTESQRRDLLRRCDAEPDGWRRCALAFLEAQAWREALGPVALAERSAGAGAQPAARVPDSTLRRLPPWLALAASVAVAFALGRVSSDRGERPATAALPAGQGIPRRPFPKPVPASEAIANPGAGGPGLAAAEPVGPDSQVGPGPGDDFALSETALREWERQGFRVERRRRVVAIDPGDGLRRNLPVDEVMLKYVGDRTF